MDKLIAAFPKNIEDALFIANNTQLKTPNNKILNIVICGMGGSGIGGKLVSLWVAKDLKVPIQIYHDYEVPAYIDENTLVIASSYSGNTEETLFFVEEARLRGSHIIGVCSGGKLQEFCNTHNFEAIIVPGGNPPRTALAFSVTQVSNILVKLGLISDSILTDLASSKVLIESCEATIKQKAKQLAAFIKDTVPVFYATTPYEAVLTRAKQQFNENSKLLCWTHVIPEMNHNELVGWGGGDNRFSAVYFDTKDLIDRNLKRVEITLEVIEKKAKLLVIEAEGKTAIERSIYIINLVDWSSFYLSEMKQEDAMDIKIIDHLKSELSNL